MCIQNSILHTHEVLFSIGGCILKLVRDTCEVYLGLGAYDHGTCLNPFILVVKLLAAPLDTNAKYENMKRQPATNMRC
jgi:hypothetical protein